MSSMVLAVEAMIGSSSTTNMRGTLCIRNYEPMNSNRITQVQNSHSTVLIPLVGSSTGNVRKQSVQVTATMPLSFFTQTAALSDLPMRGRGGSGQKAPFCNEIGSYKLSPQSGVGADKAVHGFTV
jgi:hypothetical protein